ncbi:hypothetical protein BDV38DRAFT_279841 [Aspergillus pseudotamarii]|uniref:Uncharacterized protein n=1 Tax=Aspergillus pseudotamarii TaxID=132259 RepID=A0A5N6T3H9_ASPPS|nr:uncharacterized protein BDV38DRAFT_279841 [Aspergillus pseudotamarii]KAE8140865.1 hypothetical protein BDV38DRAFT_279841 [Aspergillus pseudotamarii]
MDNNSRTIAGAITFRPNHYPQLGEDAICSNSEHSDSRSCSPENTIRRRRASFAVNETPSTRRLVHGQQDKDEDESALLRRKLRDAHAKIRRQEILLFRLQTDPYTDHQYPDTVIDREYQRFIYSVQQTAWRMCDIIGYNAESLSDAISTMRKLEHHVHQDESSAPQLSMLLSLIRSSSYSKALYRSSVAMIVFLTFERWAFSPRNISASIAPDENVAFKSIFQRFLSNIEIDHPSDQDTMARLKDAEEWRLQTALYIARSKSASDGRELTKQRILHELCQLFVTRDNSSEMGSVLSGLIDSGINLAGFLQERQSIYYFVRLKGRYDPEIMEFHEPQQAEWPLHQGSNSEVMVCIYPSLVKLLASPPFTFHVSKGKVLCRPTPDGEKLLYGPPTRRWTT